jgi:hypothetical protein
MMAEKALEPFLDQFLAPTEILRRFLDLLGDLSEIIRIAAEPVTEFDDAAIDGVQLPQGIVDVLPFLYFDHRSNTILGQDRSIVIEAQPLDRSRS